MNIHTLMQKFSELGHALVGEGAAHPISPQPELFHEVVSFLAEYPFLKKEPTYQVFLACYGGASVAWPDNSLVIDIFGFLEEVSTHLQDEFLDQVVDEDGFFMFCSTVVRGGKYEGFDDNIGIEYAFDATGKRPRGVYRFVSGKDYESEAYQWYCGTFSEWLSELIDQKGRLLDRLVHKSPLRTRQLTPLARTG